MSNLSPPPGVSETRIFPALVSFRAMCCDFCYNKPTTSCQHYGDMAAQVRENDKLIQCPHYRSADLVRNG